MNSSLLRRIGIVIPFATTALLGSTGVQAAPSQRSIEVLGSVRPAVSSELPKHAKADSGVSGVLNPRALEASAVALTLADGRRITAQLERVAKDDLKRTQSWIGTFSDEPGSLLVLTKVAGAVSGFANYGSETLEVVPVKGGRHLLYAVSAARLPRLEPSTTTSVVAGDAVATTSDFGLGGSTTAAGNAVVQDLLVVYTAAAAGAWGQATLEGMVQSAVQSANQAYQNSQVGVSLNVVGLQQVALTESSGMVATLDKLRQDTAVRTLRDRLAADMVVLISQNSDWCGYANVTITTTNGSTNTDAYAVVHSNCLSNQTLAHEVGHLQRLDHDRDNKVGAGAYEYSHGYRMCLAGGFRDIMSYACSPDVARIAQFSNPNLSYNGYPTGISYEADPARSADAARSLSNNALTVAAYRVASSSAGSTTVPVSPSGLAVSSVAYNGVSLVWVDNATDETGYIVERSPDGVSFSQVASLGADSRSFADWNVSASSSYFYRVRAFNSAGFSAYSNTVSVATPVSPQPIPPPPMGVSASDLANGSALVEWASGATTASGYEIRRETWDVRKQVWGRSAVVATVSANIFSVVDTTNNGTFRYFVRAVDSGGASSYSGPAQVTVTGGSRSGKRK